VARVQLEAVLLGVGYPLSIGVIARFLPVVRQRRWRWLAAHHLGVAAIVTGWALRGQASAAAVNASWLAASSLWYALGARGPDLGRQGPEPTADPQRGRR
jgi:hypothetical protein